METLLVFAKAPTKGAVKTRLAKERGEAQAVQLYTAFLQDTATACGQWRAQTVASDPNRRLVFACAPDGDDPVIARVAQQAGARVVAQQGDSLGERLAHAFEEEYSRGARAVCAVGTDSPTMPSYLLDDAFRALHWEQVVLGPTFDGGYWLVGAQRPAPAMFSDIPWSTPAVLATTLSTLRRQNVAPLLLPFWYDVDVAGDLERLVWHVKAARARDATALPATFAALCDIGLMRRAAA